MTGMACQCYCFTKNQSQQDVFPSIVLVFSFDIHKEMSEMTATIPTANSGAAAKAFFSD